MPRRRGPRDPRRNDRNWLVDFEGRFVYDPVRVEAGQFHLSSVLASLGIDPLSVVVDEMGSRAYKTVCTGSDGLTLRDDEGSVRVHIRLWPRSDAWPRVRAAIARDNEESHRDAEFLNSPNDYPAIYYPTGITDATFPTSQAIQHFTSEATAASEAVEDSSRYFTEVSFGPITPSGGVVR